MKTATGTTRITNGSLVDGTGAAPIPEAVVVLTDGRIAYAGPAAASARRRPSDTTIDAGGGTIMPGLVEAHFHATYFNVPQLEDLDIKYPAEMWRCSRRSTRGWRSSAGTPRPAPPDACSTSTSGSPRRSTTTSSPARASCRAARRSAAPAG